MSRTAEQTRSGLAAVWPYLLILAIGMVVLMPKLGDFGFWDPWEPKYAETAREMIERDSYIVPYYRHEVRLTKPILVYWGILAGSAVFGLNEFGARIVGVLMALASMMGTFYAVSILRGRQAGLISALVLGTLPQFYFIAREAMPDVYLFTTFGTCLLFFCLGLFGPDKRRTLHFIISYVGFALALLAKGPVIVGMVFFITLAIFVTIQIDPRFFLEAGRRLDTLRFAAVGVAGTVLCGVFVAIAFLFGTSPLWWGYNEEGREYMAIQRLGIEERFAAFRLAEILLVLVALAAAGGAVWLFKRRRPGKAGLVVPLFMAAAALEALISLFTGDAAFRIFAAASLSAAACIFVLFLALRHFMTRPWLEPIVQPYVRPVLRQLGLFAAVLLFVAGPWQIGVVIEQGHGYFTDFILKHNIQRARDTINRTGVSEFYLRVLIFGMFPWSGFIPVALASLVSWWKDNPLRRYGFEAYLIIAAVVTFTAFTAPETKFAHYLSPIVLPVAVLIGLAIHRTLEERHTIASRLTWIVALMLFILPAQDIMREEGSKYLVGSYTVKRMVPDSMAPGDYYQGLLIAIGLFMLASIVVRSRALVGALLISSTLLASWTSSVFIPRLSTNKTMKHLCETWKEQATAGEPICFYGDLKHGIFFYTDYEIERVRKREDFEEFMSPERSAFCIVERDTLRSLKTNFRRSYPGKSLEEVDTSHFGYILLGNQGDAAGDSAAETESTED